jgi:hydroxyacylglutathione hydrolase
MKNFSMLDVTTKFIAPDVESVIEGYSFLQWPKKTALLDLGSRKLDIVPIPGHTPDAIAIYDRQTGLLLTGDSVYPGRIYIPQAAIATFKKSHRRLRDFLSTSGYEIKWVLGCHIEQKRTSFEEYPMGTKRQPNEHVLQLKSSILEDIENGLEKIQVGMAPRQFMFEEFSLVIPDEWDELVDERYHGNQFTL